MDGRRASAASTNMTSSDSDPVEFVTERFERRLADEAGKLRVEMATGFGQLRADMAQMGGALQSEMIDRNAELFKWGLLFGATQVAALAGIIALLLR
jgi:hypothetical protein